MISEVGKNEGQQRNFLHGCCGRDRQVELAATRFAATRSDGRRRVDHHDRATSTETGGGSNVASTTVSRSVRRARSSSSRASRVPKCSSMIDTTLIAAARSFNTASAVSADVCRSAVIRPDHHDPFRSASSCGNRGIRPAPKS